VRNIFFWDVENSFSPADRCWCGVADDHLVWPIYDSLQHFYLIQQCIIPVFETPLLRA